MNEFTITTQLINQVLEYLGTRPYKESAGLIQAINVEYEAQLSPIKTVVGDSLMMADVDKEMQQLEDAGLISKSKRPKKVKNIE